MWNAEDIFIQLIVESDFITLIELDNVHKYLLTMDPNLIQHYNKWNQVKNKYLDVMSTETPVHYFYSSRVINKSEIINLTDSISNDELRLVARTSRIMLNEMVHAEDELSDR